MFQFATEPQGIGQILDQGIKLFRVCFKPLLPILILMMVIGVLNSLVSPVQVQVQEASDIPITVAAGMIVFGLLNIFLYTALVSRCCDVADDKGDLTDAMEIAFRKFIPVLAMYICYTLALMLGMVLLIIPGMILMFSLMLAIYVMILEDAGPIAALKRSHALVWGNWWRTATVLTVAGLMLMGFFILVFAIVGGAMFFTTPDDPQVVLLMTGFLNAVLTPLINPLLVCILLVLFKDLKVRKEGSDLESAIDTL